ncbi:MAG: hypothetical protein LBL42_02780 [Tannerella sp.]|nr:hypothetical protein [Tannerella sp.]
MVYSVFVFFTGWNEWVKGRNNPHPLYSGQFRFCDQASPEGASVSNFSSAWRMIPVKLLGNLWILLFCTGIRAQEVRTVYPPAEPPVIFSQISNDIDLAMTDFVAKDSKLEEAYIWIQQEAAGVIAAQIVREGRVVAMGVVPGKTEGRQRIYFPSDVYLEKGAVYRLRVFQGEPATVRGAVARAASDAEEIQGFDVQGPVSYDLAHELVFGAWEGDPPADLGFDERKQFPAGYEQALNEALGSNPDLWGEQLLARPEGPTFDNTKDFLMPLKLVGSRLTESGVYYIPFGRPNGPSGFGAVALHVGDGSQIISQVSTGAKTTVFVGETGRERYGYAEARLAQEYLEGGYYPVLVNEYTDVSGVKYRQESFADYSYGTTELVSFVKITVRQNARPSNVKVVFHFSGESLSLHGNTVTQADGRVRALVSSPGDAVLTDGNRLTCELDISGGDRQLYLARLLHPSSHCRIAVLDSLYYEMEKAELKDYWDGELARSAAFEVPEEPVNHARKNLLIQNMYLGYLFSIGNAYQDYFHVEGPDAACVIGWHGYLDRQKAIQQTLLAHPTRNYRNWETGEQLSHAAQYYHISGDTAFIRRNKQHFISSMAEYELQMNKPGNDGVLDKQVFSGDIDTRLVYLHHQAVAWRGMRDMAYILQSLGHAEGEKYLALAATLKSRLTDAVNKSKTVLPDGSVFIPTELFTKEKPEPYPVITETRYGSYWNLCFPYVVNAGFLDPELLPGYYRYLKDYGGLFLGMVRFNYYPVPIGGYRPDGLPGYRTPGVDNIYGLGLARILALMDDPDRMVLSFYGKLAHGMTRKTFISGEGDTMGTYPGEYYRTSYLSPTSFNNAWFLMALRLMLITEPEDRSGLPDRLHLAYSTPRAWLEHGKRIKVADAPTMFGKLDYTIDSELDRGRVVATVQLPERAGAASGISLRLRVPAKKAIRSVTVNGKAHKAFDVADETIDLSGKTGRLDIVVQYK